MPEQHLEKREQSMAYKLNVTEHADELLDNLMYHLIYRLKNRQAGSNFLSFFRRLANKSIAKRETVSSFV